jgi:hypothetical protein
MRTGFIGLGLLTALTFTTVAIADDGHGKGHKIHGQETFVAHIVLTATDSAPDARGHLNLQSVNRNGNAFAQTEIQTCGLAAGDYTLAASLKSGGDAVTIGTITVGDKNAQHKDGKDGENQDSNENGDGGGHGKEAKPLHSANHFRLPDSLNPMDISQITVADASGTTDLIGDFVNLAKGSFVAARANVALSGGDASPDARGRADLSVVAVNNTVSGAVDVSGSNLPTNTVLNVTANNQPAGTVTTTKSGSAVLHNLRNVSLQNVNQVSLTTTTGTTAASAGF